MVRNRNRLALMFYSSFRVCEGLKSKETHLVVF